MTTAKVRGRQRRHRRVRKKVLGSAQRPRLAVYRSNRHVYAQIIDDGAGRTLAAASTLVEGEGADPRAKAKSVGLAVAAKAKSAGIEQVTFDRGGFMYKGRVQAVADGAREGGLEF
ncbi:MAG: large subunit ribosomal protein [Actinomycetota bacterium]|nr:large subunit ribosomal protein [Actinomycetota bacterium]